MLVQLDVRDQAYDSTMQEDIEEATSKSNKYIEEMLQAFRHFHDVIG